MRTIFFTLILTFVGLYADPIIPETPFQKKIDLEPGEDELIAVERVIKMTEKQLEAQCKLKILIAEYRKNRDLFVKEEHSKLHARYMIRAAKEIQQIIRTYHLEHLFSSDFIEELAVLNQVGKKEVPSDGIH